MKIISGIMGILKVGVSLLWIAVFILALVYGLRGLDDAQARLDQIIDATSTSIDDINALLRETMDVMDMIDESLVTIEESTIDAGLTMIDTRPLLDETAQVVTKDVPEALEDVQATMPNLIEAAALVDDALRVLSSFHYEINNPFTGEPWTVISLGVNYDPAIPLDAALLGLSTQLDEIPEGMRGMQNDIDNASDNLVVMNEGLIDVAYDLDQIREQVADINPQLYIILTDLVKAKVSIQTSQMRIPKTVETFRKWFTGVMILAIISQIPSIYVGYYVARNDNHE